MRDDGVFDWMVVLDEQRKEREFQRDLLARNQATAGSAASSPQKIVSIQNSSIPAESRNAKAAIHAKRKSAAPGKFAEPNQSTNASNKPIHTAHSQRHEIASKRLKWWQKIFLFCRGGEE